MNSEEIFSLASRLRFKCGKGISFNKITKPDYKLFSSTQPVYICNLLTGQLSFKKNLDLLFRNSDQILSFDGMNEFIHPDDKPKVLHIVKNTLAYLLVNGINPTAHLSISYRIKKHTDRYVQVNRISRMIKIAAEHPTFNLSVLTVIPCLHLEKTVQFGWYENGAEDIDLKQFVEGKWLSIFSKRESEILELLKIGEKNADIASCLFISENTVKKHISNARMKVPQENKLALLEYFNKSRL